MKVSRCFEIPMELGYQLIPTEFSPGVWFIRRCPVSLNVCPVDLKLLNTKRVMAAEVSAWSTGGC